MFTDVEEIRFVSSFDREKSSRYHLATITLRDGMVAVQHSLPLEIDPFKLALVGVEFSGSLELSQLARLREVINHSRGQVAVKLEIGKDEFGSIFIKGSLCTQLELICQRCGGPLLYDINVDLKLCPVLMDSQAANVPEGYEPWVTHNEPISVVELVEEELLLGLPMIAKHSSEKCLDDVSHVLI